MAGYIVRVVVESQDQALYANNAIVSKGLVPKSQSTNDKNKSLVCVGCKYWNTVAYILYVCVSAGMDVGVSPIVD
jgi:hypothetical protein